MSKKAEMMERNLAGETQSMSNIAFSKLDTQSVDYFHLIWMHIALSPSKHKEAYVYLLGEPIKVLQHKDNWCEIHNNAPGYNSFWSNVVNGKADLYYEEERQEEIKC